MARYGNFSGGMPGMNMNNLMKQYQKMQKKLEETREELAKTEYSAQVGGGAVKVTVSGEKRITRLSIDKEALDPEDVETLQDMIITACNQALSEMEEDSQKKIGDIGGGLGI